MDPTTWPRMALRQDSRWWERKRKIKRDINKILWEANERKEMDMRVTGKTISWQITKEMTDDDGICTTTKQEDSKELLNYYNTCTGLLERFLCKIKMSFEFPGNVNSSCCSLIFMNCGALTKKKLINQFIAIFCLSTKNAWMR